MARTVAAPAALVSLDGALHKAAVQQRTGHPDVGAATMEDVARAPARASGAPGAPAARRVIALADGHSESPGETLSRYRMHVARLPGPVTQWPIPGTRYRADFAWPALGVVGEFDGRVKYGRSARPGVDLGRVLWEEKRREDRTRATGLTVVRWIWSEIDAPGPDGMVSRLRFVPGC